MGLELTTYRTGSLRSSCLDSTSDTVYRSKRTLTRKYSTINVAPKKTINGFGFIAWFIGGPSNTESNCRTGIDMWPCIHNYDETLNYQLLERAQDYKYLGVKLPNKENCNLCLNKVIQKVNN